MDKNLFLNWDNYKNSFLDSLSALRHEDEHSDAVLACEGKFYKVHKIVLSMCSDYFKEVFRITPCKHPVIILKDVSSTNLEFLLDYMYTGGAYIKQSQIVPLIKAAEGLNIKGLAGVDELVQDTMLPKRKRRKTSMTSTLENLSDVKENLSLKGETPFMNSDERFPSEKTPENTLVRSIKPEAEDMQDTATTEAVSEPPAHFMAPILPQENKGVTHVFTPCIDTTAQAGINPTLIHVGNDYYGGKYNQQDTSQENIFMTKPTPADAINPLMIFETSLNRLTMEDSPVDQPNISQVVATTSSQTKKKCKRSYWPTLCTYCGQSLMTAIELRDHIKLHTVDKPFLCPHCSYRCKYKCNTSKHMSNSHADNSGCPIVEWKVLTSTSVRCIFEETPQGTGKAINGLLGRLPEVLDCVEIDVSFEDTESA